MITIPNLFGAYQKGREAAIEANWNDLKNYENIEAMRTRNDRDALQLLAEQADYNINRSMMRDNGDVSAMATTLTRERFPGDVYNARINALLGGSQYGTTMAAAADGRLQNYTDGQLMTTFNNGGTNVANSWVNLTDATARQRGLSNNLDAYYSLINNTVADNIAAGRYQFLKGTWDGLARQYGLKDFSERSQDIGALALIAQKGQLERVVAGDVKGAVSKLGSIWASFPSSTYKQGKKSWDAIDRFLGGSGTSSAPAVAQQPTYNEIPQVQTPQAPQVQQTNLDSLYAMPQVATSSVQPVGVQNLFNLGGQPVSAVASVTPAPTSLFGGGLFSSQPVELTPTAVSLFRG